MKIVINGCYGGFSLSKACADKLGMDRHPWNDDARTNPALIAEVELNSEWASGTCALLHVVEIPEEATDWRLSEYDGWETITYVLDGHMYDL